MEDLHALERGVGHVLRWEFVELANQSEEQFTELCRRFQHQSGHRVQVVETLSSRRGRSGSGGSVAVGRTSRPDGQAERWNKGIVSLRDSHPAWGALEDPSPPEALGSGREFRHPVRFTRSCGVRDALTRRPRPSIKPLQRFEQAAPNQLWQMDFKGHFGLGNGERCHPLTVLDDHSRYALCLQACRNETGQTVQERSEGDVSSLWTAGAHVDGQRIALGQ